jgi:hypothetical protein
MKTLSFMLLVVGCGALAAGCGTRCNGSCFPPGYDLYTPTNLPSPLVEVTADAPCVAKLFAADGGSAQVQVTDDSATEGSVCNLHGRLADGRVVSAAVTFQNQMGDSCCPGFAASGGSFTLADGGVATDAS